MHRGKVEVFFHILFWVFIIAAINIDWTANWFDASFRPKGVAPLLPIIFAYYFYINAFYLIPKYFSLKTWYKYLLFSTLFFVVPELIRIVAYSQFDPSYSNFENALFSRDSFFFGAPSAFFLAFNSSFLYRLTKDWLLRKHLDEENLETGTKKAAVPYEDIELLTVDERAALGQNLKFQLEQQSLFLNPDLSLRDLAEAVESTEKKVSYFINQELGSSFYELINKHRVDMFKAEVAKPENKALSLVGIALNCGFPSKSSFYRAFKGQVQMSPTQYVKTLK